jgi:hypothetical protein
MGASVDFPYLVSLGPQALPAIDRYLRLWTRNYVQDSGGPQISCMSKQRDGLVQRQANELDSWRVWNFRGWRLERYLDRIAENSTAAP